MRQIPWWISWQIPIWLAYTDSIRSYQASCLSCGRVFWGKNIGNKNKVVKTLMRKRRRRKENVTMYGNKSFFAREHKNEIFLFPTRADAKNTRKHTHNSIHFACLGSVWKLSRVKQPVNMSSERNVHDWRGSLRFHFLWQFFSSQFSLLLCLWWFLKILKSTFLRHCWKICGFMRIIKVFFETLFKFVRL